MLAILGATTVLLYSNNSVGLQKNVILKHEVLASTTDCSWKILQLHIYMDICTGMSPYSIATLSS